MCVTLLSDTFNQLLNFVLEIKMEFLLSFLLPTTCLIIFLHFVSLFHRRKLPPGPLGLPIFKNLFDIGPKPHESLANLAKKFGPLITITLGSMTTIVISSPKMAQEVLQKKDEIFSGRTVPDSMALLDSHTPNAVAWISTGELWRTVRKVLSIFLTSQQKLDSLCDLRHRVVQEMVQHVKKVGKKSECVDIGKLAFTTALNQMSNTCFSVNVADYETRDFFIGFHKAVKTIMEIDARFNIGDYFPLLKWFDLQGIRRENKKAYGFLDGLCDKFIAQRLKDRESKMERFGDLLDCFLDFSQENESQFNLRQIHVLLVELFMAGTETSSITTEWAMSELMLHPQKMEKLRQEITESVSANGKVDETAIIRLPYLQAVVKETMRLHLAVPLLLPHKTEKQVELFGYEIPKNTQVLVNAWAIARDPIFWENPEVFMPERFLDSEIESKGQHFTYLPFGSGRRMCPGIYLAERVVSLMIASLVYNFEWKLPNGNTPEKLDMNDKFGLTLQRTTPLMIVPTALEF